uniref:Membrane protein required for colicin V production n=2 Tax=unclassified Candidatus Kentrum TaxID=2643149 RepID=A0A451AW14_9GAMM|nr:MAG: membrane protein required for colicin V production [Candidatus Kentron sp. LPFa]VFK12294.1 MAG: membrane protein required for colicin V production [Candidatus Kentron sp. LPFa]VFK24311.1 MAG: membrane protein required for colicin V production [Candidatus Kentron sp. LPFa]VFK65804.1 MAG: membrane protein required for colicin V production [Candidatus Kentron sp. UNK]VFK70241.1 MAG: membrane protein required for colicin V production [Candidatus Kentron sp. UNK]
MNWVDYVILAIIGISAMISISRGFMSEALSLFGWILAFWIALTFMDVLAVQLSTWISAPSARLVISFFTLLFVTLLLTAMLNRLVTTLVIKTGLSGTDRVLGIVFGIVRGIVIVVICVLLAGLTTLPRDPWWQESLLISRHFQTLAIEIRALLPPELATYLRY